jgi:hypothetical protein
MFVRIKKTPIYSSDNRQTLDYSLRFVVVKSYRKDGSPRQKIVKYLGSVRASKLKSPSFRREFIHQMNRVIEASEFGVRQRIALNLSLIRCVVRGGYSHVNI